MICLEEQHTNKEIHIVHNCNSKIRLQRTYCSTGNSTASVSIVSYGIEYFQWSVFSVLDQQASDTVRVVTEHVQLQVFIPVSEDDEELVGSSLDGG